MNRKSTSLSLLFILKTFSLVLKNRINAVELLEHFPNCLIVIFMEVYTVVSITTEIKLSSILNLWCQLL